MKQPAQADIQRWSDEVARDPRSLAFLPLARSYRKQGLHEAALHLCMRGLDAHPSHVEAHGLLAMLYLDKGEHQKAADEWSMVLRMDPDNFEALRGMGFCYLEQDRLTRARQMLERAALLRPSDPTVEEALRVLGSRQDGPRQSAPADVGYGDDPWSAAPDEPIFMFDGVATEPEEQRQVPSSAEPEPEPALPPRRIVPAVPVTGPVPLDPGLIFDDLLGAGPLLGALLVDPSGLIIAGRLTEGLRGDPATLGAVLGGAVMEATRTASYLQLGSWHGILLDSEHALIHLAPAGAAGVLLLAARRDAPAGWVRRASAHAVGVAQQFIEEYA